MTTDLERLCESLKIKADVTYGNAAANRGDLDEWQRTANPWTVRLRFQRRSLTVPFWTGFGWTREPGPADVLSSLARDAAVADQSFEDFCSDLGYDPDSRRAERIWRECQKLAPRVRRFLGDAFDLVANADH